jgi:uncharacterized protein (TIGR03085 family)
MPSHSAAERAALAEALADAGPRRPTLCDGWTTTELAAHLVSRERRPDATAGLMIGALAGWSDRVRGRYAARPYPELVRAFRTGPPWTSLMAIPGVDARANLVEHFVHCEDVRRAGPGWSARELPAGRQDALWASLSTFGRMLFRRSPVSVTLRTPDGLSKQVIDRSAGGAGSSGGSAEGVHLVGLPAELTLYGYGRKDQALVQVEGPDDAVAAFRRITLEI